jgi:hypothetical protein
VSPEKVLNVCCAVDPEYQPYGDSYGLPFSYFLRVSNRKRHKNEFRIAEALCKGQFGFQDTPWYSPANLSLTLPA